MTEKKHIDRLYQEKFKDFEASPDDAVWKSISAKLQEKDQKRVFVSPMWSRLAGIAAVLSIVFLIGDWFFPEPLDPAVVSKEIENGSEEGTTSVASNNKLSAIDKESAGIPAKFEEKNLSKKAAANPELTLLKTPPGEKIVLSQNEEIASTEMAGKAHTSKLLLNVASLLSEVSMPQEQKDSQNSGGELELTTHAAPIYYGNFGKGNFIDPRFSNSNGQGEVTYSYGINIAYSISDKIKIRSGVNKVNVSYNTSGVSYQAIVGPVTINTISYTDHKDPESTITAGSSVSKRARASDGRDFIGNVKSGLLNQKMGFIEIPVELEYNLIKKKFELNIIGGASTLFLDENRVSMNAGGFSAVGKANNLNEVSFSTNIGIGLDYNLSERFKLNLEPIFKYQLNTFSTTSTNTQPYYLGIYSGFSYSF